MCDQQSRQVQTLVELRGVNCPRKLSASTSFLAVLGVMRSILGTLGVLEVLGVMISNLGVLGVMKPVLGVMEALGVCGIVVSLAIATITPKIQQNQYQEYCSTKDRCLGIIIDLASALPLLSSSTGHRRLHYTLCTNSCG